MHSTKGAFVSAFLLAGALAAAACDSPSDVAENSKEPVAERAQRVTAPDDADERITVQPQSEGASDVKKLLGALDLLGPDADEAFNRERDRYLRADPTGAKLRDAYHSLPAEARSSAWKIVYAASTLQTDECVRLLEEVALSKTAKYRDPHAEAVSGGFDDPGAVDMTVKILAAVGLAQQSAAVRVNGMSTLR